MLLGTFVDEVWWPSCGKLRECTRVGYESAYRCHIQPKWADVDMESITANDIEEWLGSFNQAGAARKALLQTCFNPLLPAPFCAKPACRGQRQARKALPRRPCGKKAGRCGRDGRRRETRAKGARLPQLKSVETGSSS